LVEDKKKKKNRTMSTNKNAEITMLIALGVLIKDELKHSSSSM
jgi:hypothetical protein